jgi:hypothetical protein
VVTVPSRGRAGSYGALGVIAYVTVVSIWLLKKRSKQ